MVFACVFVCLWVNSLTDKINTGQCHSTEYVTKCKTEPKKFLRLLI